MNWKDILKEQTSLLDFSRPAEMESKLPEIKSKLESMKGRARTTERGKTEDLATVRLEQLESVKTPDEFDAFYNKNLKFFLGEK